MSYEPLFVNGIDLNNTNISNAYIKNTNFSNKNICIIKDSIDRLPTALSLLEYSTFLYIGKTKATLKKNTIYSCRKGDDGKYAWTEIAELGGADAIKVVDTLPTATADNLGNVYLNNDTLYKSELIDSKYVNSYIGIINSFSEDTSNLKKNILYLDSVKGFCYYNGTELKNILSVEKMEDIGDTLLEKPTKGDFIVFDEDNKKWGKSSLLFENGTIATTKVGGIAKDADLSNMNIIDVLKQMLTGSIDPANLALNDITTTYKKGETVDLLVVEATCKSTDVDLVKIEWYKDDTLLKTTSLSGKSATAKYVYESISENCTIKAVLTLANGETFDAERNIKFILPSYYGINGNLKEIMLESKGVVLVFDYGDTMVQPIYKYPASYGLLEKITDESGNDNYFNSFTQTTEIINSVEYNVYTKKEKAVHKSFKYWFR